MTTQESSEPFDPTPHLIKLPRRVRNSDGAFVNVELNYLEVAWRLVWLRSAFPNAKYDTELIHYDVDASGQATAVFKARLWDEASGRQATGWGREVDGKFPAVEKAETSALGRALAGFGLGTPFCDDFSEPQGEDGRPKIVDSPVQGQQRASTAPPPRQQTATTAPAQRQQPPSNVSAMQRAASGPTNGGSGGGGFSGPMSNAPLSEPQRRAIYAIGHGKDLDDAQIEALVVLQQQKGIDALTRAEASKFIDFLKEGDLRAALADANEQADADPYAKLFMLLDEYNVPDAVVGQQLLKLGLPAEKAKVYDLDDAQLAQFTGGIRAWARSQAG